MQKQIIRVEMPGQIVVIWERPCKPVPDSIDQYKYRDIKENRNACIVLSILIIVAGIVAAVIWG